MLVKAVVITVISVCIVWVGGFFYFHNITLPTLSVRNQKRVLFVFPHPDDEVLPAGGLIKKLNAQGSETTLLLLTKGEQGPGNILITQNIKDIRTKEASKAADILGVTSLIHLDLGDNALDTHEQAVQKAVEKAIKEYTPDTVVTYDLSGLYGHPDHITTSRVTTRVVKATTKYTELWYVTYPKKILEKINLPYYMADNWDFLAKRSQPSHRIFVGNYIMPKIKALYAYESQRNEIHKSFPTTYIPLWFYASLGIYEYYYKAY